MRIKRSGAQWYKINANRMLRIRCAVVNQTFDNVFTRYKHLQLVGPLQAPKTFAELLAPKLTKKARRFEMMQQLSSRAMASCA